MEIEEYIDENYRDLFIYIFNCGIHPEKINRDEIEMWIMNDEYLYTEALENGVDI